MMNLKSDNSNSSSNNDVYYISSKVPTNYIQDTKSDSNETSNDDQQQIKFQHPTIEYNKLKNLNIKLGSGAFGQVFKYEYDECMVAVKSQESSNEFYQNELRIYEHLNKLNHPSLIKLIGIFDNPDSKSKCIVFELAKGYDLKQFVCKNLDSLRADPVLLLNLVTEIVNVMEFLHNQSTPIIHGDLSLSNFIATINEDNKVSIKIIDFGLALINNALDFIPIRGQVKYISPEVLNNGRSSLSPMSDVFAFSIMLCEIFIILYLGDVNYDTKENGESVKPGDIISLMKHLYKENQFSSNIHQSLATIAYECCEDKSFSRPTFSSVLQNLKELKRLVS